MWCLANKEFSSNVAMALVRSFTRVFSAREAWQTKTQSQSCTRFPWKPPARSCLFWYTLKVERIGLWATLMLKLRRTFVTLSENPLAQGRITKPRWSVSLISCCLLRWRPLRMIFVCLFFEVSTDRGYQFFFYHGVQRCTQRHTKSNFSRTPAMFKELLNFNSYWNVSAS